MTTGSGTVHGRPEGNDRPPPTEVELTVVTMTFDASDAAMLAGLLSRYAVMTRTTPGCRNVDLCSSLGVHERFVIIEKWDSPSAQSAHFRSPATEAFAQSLEPALRSAPQIDLLESISAHDLA